MNNMKLNKKIITLTMGGIALVLLLVILSTIGSVNLSFGEIFIALINNDNKMVTTIVYKMRLPRNILAALVGANLAVSGLLLPFHLLLLEFIMFYLESRLTEFPSLGFWILQ